MCHYKVELTLMPKNLKGGEKEKFYIQKAQVCIYIIFFLKNSPPGMNKKKCNPAAGTLGMLIRLEGGSSCNAGITCFG